MFLPVAFLASGCVYVLRSASPPTDVKLRLETTQSQQYVVRVAFESPADYPVAADGRVQFGVPRFDNGCAVLVFGVIKTRDGSVENRRLVELRRNARVVRRLSLAQIAELPKDRDGFSIVRVGD